MIAQPYVHAQSYVREPCVQYEYKRIVNNGYW